MGIKEAFSAAKEKIGRAFNREKPKKDLGGESQEQIPTARIETIEQTQKYSISVGGETEKSNEHKENEDNFYISERTAAVFDGMGGHAGGEIASGIAAEAMPEFDAIISKKIAAAEMKEKKLTSEEEAELIGKELREFLIKVNSEIYQTGKENPDLKGLASTASAMRFTRDGKKLVIGQMGDSRIYRLREGRLERISPEDSLVETAVKYGLIASDQNIQEEIDIDEVEKKMKEISGRKDMKKDEKQEALNELFNLITYLGQTREEYRERFGIDRKKIPIKNFRHIVSGNALGIKDAEPHIVAYDVEAGDRYLVSSDGVHDNLTDEQIIQIMIKRGRPEEIAKNLVLASKRISQDHKNPRAKEDDMTAIIVEVTDKAEVSKFEEKAKLEKTRKNLEADLEKFQTTINTLGIKGIRDILETLTRERNALETKLQSNPDDEELALQLEFTRRKEELTAQRLEKEYKAEAEAKKPTRPMTPEEEKRVLKK
ncbi:MAG: PP2C family serine/threonine-protein phosphatase [Patescibacteria group bacterium]